MTTEFALLPTCMLGGLALRNPLLAAGLGTVLASLLAARNRLHHFVRSVLMILAVWISGWTSAVSGV